MKLNIKACSFMKAIDNFYFSLPQPTQDAFLALRDIIFTINPDIESKLSYGCPFFFYRKKRFCYLWKDKKTQLPYIGIIHGDQINHPALEKGTRKKMKIYQIQNLEELQIEEIKDILVMSLQIIDK